MSLLKITNRFANRGEGAEGAVQKALTQWAQHSGREFSRLVDSKAAGRTIKAAAADFEFYSDGRFGLIEVKETKHAFRLERKRITQMARLRKRANCGGVCLVLVYHSTEQLWRCLGMPYMLDSPDTAGSWDMRDLPTWGTAMLALRSAALEVF